MPPFFLSKRFTLFPFLCFPLPLSYWFIFFSFFIRSNYMWDCGGGIVPDPSPNIPTIAVRPVWSAWRPINPGLLVTWIIRTSDERKLFSKKVLLQCLEIFLPQFSFLQLLLCKSGNYPVSCSPFFFYYNLKFCHFSGYEPLLMQIEIYLPELCLISPQ